MGSLQVCHSWTSLFVSDPTVGRHAQPVPLASFSFIPTALSQAGGALLLAYPRALCPIPSLARSPAVTNFVPVLGHLGRPPQRWVRLHPWPVLLNPSAGVCRLPCPGCCYISGRHYCTFPRESPGNLWNVLHLLLCNISCPTAKFRVGPHGSHGSLGNYWKMMENACRAVMLYLPRKVLSCG